MTARLHTLLAMFVILILCTTAATAFEPGTSGLLFLRLGVGERAAGMGEAYTAMADDATALYWNPAGLAALENTQLHLMHNEWMLSLRHEFIGIAHPTSLGTFAVGVTALNMDEMELREDTPSATPIGHFSAFDLAVHAGYGREIKSGVQAGAAMKMIYSRLYEENAKGLLFDLGIRYRGEIPGLTVAAAILNLGGKFSYVNEQFDAPRTIKLGGAYNLPFQPAEGELYLAYDLLLVSDSDSETDDALGESKAMNARHHIGAEYDFRGRAALRVGYKLGYDSQDLSVGAGIRWQNYRLDYAFLNVDNDLGNAHRFGMTLDF
ncbi:MAG: UPF0164 family protein [bacterium]|nr:UPF0164 family protein [bacterium]